MQLIIWWLKLKQTKSNDSSDFCIVHLELGLTPTGLKDENISWVSSIS